MSKTWINQKLHQTTIDENKVNVFFEALVNTINHTLQSDHNSSNQQASTSIFNEPVFAPLGLSPLVNVSPTLLNAEDKAQTMVMLCLATQEHADKNQLTHIMVTGSREQQMPKNLQQQLNQSCIGLLSSNPPLATPDNPLALNLFRNMLKNNAIKPKTIQQEKSLLAWGIKQQDANILNLIIQAYKLERPKQSVIQKLNKSFSLNAKQNTQSIFPNWPDCIHDVKTSALCLAVLRDNTALVNTLLQEGMDVNAVDQYGHSPLTYAATLKSTDMLDFLIRHGANVHGHNTAQRKIDMPPILAATMAGNTPHIQKLVEAGADTNQAAHGSKLTPLHIAYIERDVELIKTLYQLGAKHGDTKAVLFDAPPLTKKRTPLELVLNQLKSPSLDKQSKLNRSERNKEFAYVYVLHHVLNQTPFDTQPLIHGYPLIHALTYQNNLEALTLMMDQLSHRPLEKSIQLNTISSKGTQNKTPLMVAAQQGNISCLKYLLTHPETNVLVKDAQGRTALDIAKQFSRQEAENLLQTKRPTLVNPSPPQASQTGTSNLNFRRMFRRHG